MPNDPEFGDHSPEDSWDDADPVVVRLGILVAVWISLYTQGRNGDLAGVLARKAAIREAVHDLFLEAEAELAS